MYAVTDCYETFPFLEPSKDLKSAGEAYYAHRAAIMVATDLGLTKTYNRFHDPDDKAADVVELRRLHDAMDRAVLRAYGWDDLAKRAKAEFLTKQSEDDPKYQGRLFWPAEFRAEVLSRLLALNAERHAAEQTAGAAGKTTKARPAKVKDRNQAELL